MKYTTNLNLKKPEYTDPADIENINDNMDIIDTQLADMANQTDFITHTENTTNAHGIDTKSPLRITNNTIITNTVLALADANKRVFVNSASAVTITIPLNSSVLFSVGDEIEVLSYGVGKITIVGEVGVTIRSRDNNKVIDGQYAIVSLLKIATDEWLLIGALTA